jgi:hypothetical protein
MEQREGVMTPTTPAQPRPAQPALQLYKGNKSGAAYQMTAQDIAEGFWQSTWGGQKFDGQWPLDARIATYLSVGAEYGGLDSTWDDNRGAFEDVCEIVHAGRPERKESH